jgi:hypothetical protein
LLWYRSHNFDTTHARKVLAAHSLGGLRSERQILSVLQSNRAARLDSDSSDDDDLFSFLNLPHVPRARGTEKAKQTSPTQPMFHSTDSDDSANEKTEICGFNLRGKCSYGNKCKSLHTGR